VVCLWETRADEAVPAAAQRVATDGLAVVQALRGRSPVRLWWVTTGAAAVEPGDVVEAGTAPVWGLGRTVMQEHPELGCTLVDVEPGAPDVEALARELGTNDGESQVAWRAGRRRVARLVRAAPMTADVPAPIPTRGTVLVTGGLGALGLHVARWLAQQGVPHLVLTGRRGLGTTGAAEAVAELEALGARVTVAAVDVADREGLRAVLAAIPTEWPLRGVVHAAGVLDDGVLAEQTMERFARVLSPKVAGSWNLHELTAGDDLAFFVLFSSVAGLLGAGGQGNYAAANTFLDALAAHRRRKGLAGQSVAWGPWSEGGKAAGLGAEQKARLARQGMGALSPSEGVALLGQALGRPEAMLGAVRLDLPAVGRAFGEAVPPVWRTLVRAPARPAAAGVQGSWAARLAALPPAEREGEVRAAVQADLARVLGLGVASEVPADRRFSDLGLDSLMAVELRNTLGRRLGKTLPASLAFEHPTIDGLTHWLVEQLSSAPAAPSLGAPDEEILVIPLEGDEAFERFATLSSQVYARIQVKAGMWSPEGAERLSRQMLDDLLPQGLSTPHHSICTLVEPTRGEPVGHHWCGRREVDKVSVFYWYSMEIAESHQGKGYGPQVMKLLEEKAREQHVRFALANVGAANPWRSMLHKLGWSDTTGRLMKRVDALPAEGRSSPALQLIPLEGNEAFERFATLSSQVYARDQVNSGLWSPEGAEPLARQVLNELLPGGLSTPHHCFYTLVEPDRGEPVGYLWYGPREADKVRVLHCHRLIIFAGHRRKGHGLTAMRLVEEKARAQDLRFVLANVNARDQASRAMLQKLGWSEVDWRLMKPVGSPA
jgi:NAD(P)-dependent dehydrogenase (short-subunit alcohol dehydrogenase family)/RimJ/RimL family protein N-acetyltransferase/acyl carrier protein